MSSKWFVKPRSIASPKIRLYCFPYAGGAATTYIPWAEKIAEYVELVIVQPPGRGSRIMESAHNTMEGLLEELYPQVVNDLVGPYVFFGHSLGSRVAFELLCLLQRNSVPLPLHFVASGSRAPHIPSRNNSMHDLPNNEFITVLKKLNGTPDEVLQNKELMEMYMPLLRSDFEISDKYWSTTKISLDVPVSVFGGDDDVDISVDDLLGWQHNFTNEVDLHHFPGGHFFVESCMDEVVAELNRIVERTLMNRSG